MSAAAGSEGLLKETLPELPSATVPPLPRVAVGLAFVIPIVVVYWVNPPSLSNTRARTTRPAGPSARNDAGTVVESVVTLHNRAEIAWCRGDLPLALRLYDEAAEQYAALGEDYWGLVRDRCEVMLAAGLADEAAALATRRIEASDLSATQEAELLLMLAAAQLSLGESGAAVDSA